MENVIWKRMIYHGKDFGDFYLVSNTGEIKGVKTGKIRKKNINHEGYYFVGISVGSREDKPCIKVHRAIAETFLVNKEDYPVINHIDGNKLNNNICNLEFCTYSDNSIHAYKNGLIGRQSTCISVIRMSDNKKFDSISDAARFVNPVNVNSAVTLIGHAIRNNRSAYGYKWKYL